MGSSIARRRCPQRLSMVCMGLVGLASCTTVRVTADSPPCGVDPFHFRTPRSLTRHPPFIYSVRFSFRAYTTFCLYILYLLSMYRSSLCHPRERGHICWFYQCVIPSLRLSRVPELFTVSSRCRSVTTEHVLVHDIHHNNGWHVW